MFGRHWCRISMGGGIGSVLSRVLPVAGMITVLLFLIKVAGSAEPEGAVRTNMGAFTFTCEFRALMGPACLEGLMVSHGDRHRIAIYSIEPRMLRDAAHYLRYSDFIIGPEATHYWVYGISEPGTIRSSDDVDASVSPQDNSPKSVVLSALAIVGCIRGENKGVSSSLEVGRFLQGSRGQPQYTYVASHDEAASDDTTGSAASHMEAPNTLTDAGEYSKRTLSDGSVVWKARSALNPDRTVTVTVSPMTGVKQNDDSGLFDPNNLGHWGLVPECHRAYWSFDRIYCELSLSPDVRTAGVALYEQIEAYLRENSMPAHLCRAMDHLRFKAAVMSCDTDRIRSSAQACVDGFWRDKSLDTYECLMELGRISGQIERDYSRYTEQWLRPLVRQMAQRVSPETMGRLDILTATIEGNEWFTYGRLLLEELRGKGLMNERDAAALAARLEATRIARTPQPVDPFESSASVARYMAHLDDAPLKGSLDMDDLRIVLEKGLAKAYGDGDPQMKRKVVDDVLRSIHLIAGDGPFCGDEARLTASIERFSVLYLVVCKTDEPIDTVLATFLALSFCDTSTAEDHDILFSQFHERCVELQSQVDRMLSDRGLGRMVTREDVNGVFALYERIFRGYVDDPLWPAFKFPFTRNEQSRLAAALKLRFMQLETALDPFSIKVKYGGASAELKKKTIHTISLAVQQLLPRAAFLRRPPYPGVSCQYRGGHGFSAAVRGPLYEEGDRPKEKFKAMKYFHLGHRLQEVVERERESWILPVAAVGSGNNR